MIMGIGDPLTTKDGTVVCYVSRDVRVTLAYPDTYVMLCEKLCNIISGGVIFYEGNPFGYCYYSTNASIVVASEILPEPIYLLNVKEM